MLKKILKGILIVFVLLLAGAFLKFRFLGKRLDTTAIQPYLTQSQEDKDNLILTYLGCAGFIFQYHGESILCDPYISNPGLLEFGKMHTAWKDKIPVATLKQVSMVTISHGHYDHCYDISDLCQYLSACTPIIGDASVQYQLDAIYRNQSLHKIPLHFNETQQWIYNADSTFRIFPLQSIHNPHIGKIELLKGKYTQALTELPTKAWQWKKGEAYSYLIDILNQYDSIQYRTVLVNGNFTKGALTQLQQLCSNRKADFQLQIFWKEKLVTKNMLDVYAAAKPREIILHHWNNFFIPFDQPLEYLRDAHLPQVLERYNKEGIKMSMMLPFTSVYL